MIRRALDDGFLKNLRMAVGEDRVDVSALTLEAYARDLSTLGHLRFRWQSRGVEGAEPLQPPQAVVRPTNARAVEAVVRLCAKEGVPLIPWGAGSGVCGGTFAPQGGVALDLKGLDRLVELDRRSLLVTVEPGMNLQLLEDALGREGYMLGHLPSSITCSTIGGAIAARGAGQLSTRYGKIEDMVVSLDVVLPDGTRVQTARVPRAATGPDWNQVFVGSEGTLGIIVRSTLRIHRLPALRLFRSYEFPSVSSALEAIREGLQLGARPAAVRLYDPLDTLMVARASDAPSKASQPQEPVAPTWPLSQFSVSKLGSLLGSVLPEAAKLGKKALLGRPQLANKLIEKLPGKSLLILTFEGEPELAHAEAAIMHRACEALGGKDKGPEPAERWWRNKIAVSFKQSGVYMMGGFVDTMEVATTWERLEELHAKVRAALAPHALVMAHFSHAYAEGCSIYLTFVAMQEGPGATLERYHAAWKDALEACIECGAAISHHHGIGVLKADALRASQGALHKVLVEVKKALDPGNVLNPGKLGLP